MRPKRSASASASFSAQRSTKSSTSVVSRPMARYHEGKGPEQQGIGFRRKHMRMQRWISKACAAGLLIAAMITAGCGLITAPLSMPAAVAENADFSLRGPVVDQQGKPLSGV